VEQMLDQMEDQGVELLIGILMVHKQVEQETHHRQVHRKEIQVDQLQLLVVIDLEVVEEVQELQEVMLLVMLLEEMVGLVHLTQFLVQQLLTQEVEVDLLVVLEELGVVEIQQIFHQRQEQEQLIQEEEVVVIKVDLQKDFLEELADQVLLLLNNIHQVHFKHQESGQLMTHIITKKLDSGQTLDQCQ